MLDYNCEDDTIRGKMREGTTTTEEKMDNVTTVAIAKGLKKAVVSEASNNLAVGTHGVDAYIHISGTIKKGADKEQKVHMNTPYKKLCLSLLAKVNGATRNKTIEDAIKGLDEMTEVQETEISEAVNESWKKLTDKAKQVTAGKVTTQLVFEEVNADLANLEEVEEIETIEEVAEEV